MSIGSFLSPGQIGPLTLVSDGVFCAEAIAPTGETMYLAIETLDYERRIAWKAYRNAANLMIRGAGGGRLIEIASKVNDLEELNTFLNTQKNSQFWTSDNEIFDNLCRNLKKRPISQDDSRGISTIFIATAIDINNQTHMVYASKTPITGHRRFTCTESTHTERFRNYVNDFGNIIMSVGVEINREYPVVENRGIFRNPLSIVEGGYGGISMMLHSFTCMAVKEVNPAVSRFYVRPKPKMEEIFLKAISEDKLQIVRVNEFGMEVGEPDLSVGVDVLANLHRAPQ